MPAERLFDNEVTLLIRYPESAPVTPLLEFELTFSRVRGMRLMIDFVAKSMTNDSISWAGEVLLADHPELADLFKDLAQPIAPSIPDASAPRLFVVDLIPTGGTIHILADELTVQERPFQP
jgi:hypothetical protein